MRYFKGVVTTASLFIYTTCSFAAVQETVLIDSNDMESVGFNLTGEDVSLTGNTFLFPKTGHYCAKKTITGEFVEGSKISLDMDPEEAHENGLSLNIMTWGSGKYKGFGGSKGASSLEATLEFDTDKLSIGFCRYNNNSFDSFNINEIVAKHSIEVEDAPQDENLEVLIDSDHMESIGFNLTGDEITLANNTFTFPSSGHYCAKKVFKGSYKTGDEIILDLDPEEASTNGLSLNIMAWGSGKYKGFGGSQGVSSLTAVLEFDTDTLSIGFCRYNNSSYDPFNINSFKGVRKLVQTTPEEDLLPVYEGCKEYVEEDPEVLIIDETEPKSLQDLVNNGTIKPGMIVKLRRMESSLVLYKTAAFLDSDSPWLTIVGENDGGIERVSLTSVKNIRFTNLKMGNIEPNYIINTYETENIILDNNYISAGEDYQNWDAQKWQEIASGVNVRRSKCTSVYNNELRNLRFGLNAYVRDDDGNSEVLSQKTLFKKNFIQNISADFIRAIGSDVTIDGNIGLDHYVSGDDGDENHDDFIQGFSYPIGVALDNVKILNNYYQSTSDVNRSLQSDGQGIVIFDGLYTNFEIINNTMISNHWHGITVFWGKDGLIKNNTTVVSDDSTGRYMWIQSQADKTGAFPPENVKVTNNVTNYLSLHPNTSAIAENNIVIPKEETRYNFVLFDPENLNYDVEVKKDSVYYVEDTGSTTTSIEKTK